MAKSSVSEQKIPTALARIGITSPREALLVAPVSYTNYTVPIAVLPVPDQDEPTFIRVLLKDLIGIDKDGGIVEVSSGLARMVKGDVLDELGNEANFVAFQALRAWKEVQPGQDIHLYGRLSVRGANGCSMTSCSSALNSLERCCRCTPASRGLRAPTQ